MSADPYADRRCRRGEHCTDRTPARDDTGEPVGPPVAVLLEDPAAEVWCQRCRSRLLLALRELPRILASFTLARVPSMSSRYDGTGVGGGHLDHSPVPLELRLDAAARYVTAETAVWADVVADRAGLVAAGEWTPDTATTGEACQLLAHRATQWLPIGRMEYRARSIDVEPWRGHDPDTTTRYGRDWWCRRDAATSADTLVDVHHRLVRARAELLAARDHPEWTSHTCRSCEARQVFYLRSECRLECRSCAATWSEQSQLTLGAVLAAAC